MNNHSRVCPLSELLAKGDGTVIKSSSKSLTYENLRSVVSRIGNQLAFINVGPGDSVGIVTPNGPEAATIFISVASFATAAPLNPVYTKDEFKFYLQDLNAKVLLVLENSGSEAVAAATELGIKIIKIRPQHLPGDITLIRDGCILETSLATKNQAKDVSLILHTSGTTSRPKIVPLTSDNILISCHFFTFMD